MVKKRVFRIGDKRNTYNIFVRKPEGKRPLEITRCSCKRIIKMVLRQVTFGGVNWGERSLVGSCNYGNEPLSSMKCREFIDELSVLLVWNLLLGLGLLRRDIRQTISRMKGNMTPMSSLQVLKAYRSYEDEGLNLGITIQLSTTISICDTEYYISLAGRVFTL